MPLTLRITDHSLPQAWILVDATSSNDGIMTARQAQQLAALVAGGGIPGPPGPPGPQGPPGPAYIGPTTLQTTDAVQQVVTIDQLSQSGSFVYNVFITAQTADFSITRVWQLAFGVLGDGTPNWTLVDTFVPVLDKSSDPSATTWAVDVQVFLRSGAVNIAVTGANGTTINWLISFTRPLP